MSDPEKQVAQQPDDNQPKMVTLTIDGREVSVPEGVPLLDAASQVGIEISSFCHHPGLSVVAVCRQCLVTIEGSGKLVPSCQAVTKEGMIVHTQDERSTAARQQMLEFTLLNHPIDCPICDKAGECTLQKNYFDYDNHDSRVDVEKVHKPKVVDLGPHIVLDAERCIMCDRCVRVCDQVAGVHQLEFSNRGDHTVLGTAPGQRLDNPYSLNTVDVCPVGALTSKDFRFTMRAWELFSTPSICPGCSTGCNIEIHHRDERVWRVIPRENAAVNGWWMCDDGRFEYHSLREKRLAVPLENGLPSSWERALATAAAGIRKAIESDRESLGVVLSAQHSNEANYLLAKLARDHLGASRIYIAGKKPLPSRADDKLMDADVNPNRTGVLEILGETAAGGPATLEADLYEGTIKALLILGHDLPLNDQAVATVAALDTLIVITDRELGITNSATTALPAAAWVENDCTTTNRDGVVQRLRAAYPPQGLALPAWEIVAKLARACDAAMDYPNARTVFDDMIANVPAFAGSKWGRHVRPIQLRFAGSRG